MPASATSPRAVAAAAVTVVCKTDGSVGAPALPQLTAERPLVSAVPVKEKQGDSSEGKDNGDEVADHTSAGSDSDHANSDSESADGSESESDSDCDEDPGPGSSKASSASPPQSSSSPASASASSSASEATPQTRARARTPSTQGGSTASDQPLPKLKKIRWHEEPYIQQIREAVEIVLSGKSACKVARARNIPGRTLRRYVLKERKRLNKPRVPKRTLTGQVNPAQKRRALMTNDGLVDEQPTAVDAKQSDESPSNILWLENDSSGLFIGGDAGSSATAETKVRWYVEPHLTRIRFAVAAVLSGRSASKVADERGIPARTLRRYVMQARHKNGAFSSNIGLANNQADLGAEESESPGNATNSATEADFGAYPIPTGDTTDPAGSATAAANTKLDLTPLQSFRDSFPQLVAFIKEVRSKTETNKEEDLVRPRRIASMAWIIANRLLAEPLSSTGQSMTKTTYLAGLLSGAIYRDDICGSPFGSSALSDKAEKILVAECSLPQKQAARVLQLAEAVDCAACQVFEQHDGSSEKHSELMPEFSYVYDARLLDAISTNEITQQDIFHAHKNAGPQPQAPLDCIKLLGLADEMHTGVGRALAARRLGFLVQYVKHRAQDYREAGDEAQASRMENLLRTPAVRKDE